MPKLLSLEPHATQEQLYKLYLDSQRPCERDRYHAIWLFSCGKRTAEVADVTRFSARGLRVLVRRYNAGGLQAMEDKRRHTPGAKSVLSSQQCQRLKQALAGPPPDGGLWDSLKVAAWIQSETGYPANKQLGWDYLKRLDYVLRVPRRRHRKGDPELQEQFKKKTCPKPPNG